MLFLFKSNDWVKLAVVTAIAKTGIVVMHYQCGDPDPLSSIICLVFQIMYFGKDKLPVTQGVCLTKT